MKRKVCMVVQDKMVKGGIAAVISGYYGSELEEKIDITYVESYKDGSKLSKLLKGIKGYLQFLYVLACNRPDLVHIHSSFGPSFYRKLPFIYMASFFDIPIINHIHGADFEQFYVNASQGKKSRIRNAYAKCSLLIALSDEWKEKLSLIVDKNKIVVIENYSNLMTEAYGERKVRKINNRILFLGELGKRKGCYDIPFVAKETRKEIPNIEFILCGAGTAEDEAIIRKLCAENKVDDIIKFPGWVRGDIKDSWIRSSDIFFLPSYNEGMPMSVLDAMGYGMPIVSTEVGGIPKIVRDGENGFCCKPGNIVAYKDAIISILKNEELLRKLGEGSYHIVKESYSREKHIAKLMNIYERVMM